MPGRPYSGLKAQAETVVAASDPIGFDDDEKTTVEPGSADSFEEAKTVADPPEGYKITRPQNVPLTADAGSETVDEATIEESGAQVSGVPDASLVVTQGPHKGERFKIEKIVVMVGRALDNDVVLADTSVSRRHLKIEFDGLNFFLQDLGSGNGTVVNGRDQDDRFKLSHRDALELGRSMLAFDCPAAARPALDPPLARPQSPRPPPVAAPVPARADNRHPAFDDFDEDASTIAGERPPGPDEIPLAYGRPLRAPSGARPSGKNRSLQRPEDLVMPRSPPNDRGPRRTVASPAVPAPMATPRPSPVRRPTSIPPPPPRQPSIEAPAHLDDSSEGLTRPARPGHSAGPSPSTTLPPIAVRPHRVSNNGRPPQVVYPSAPSQFIRSAPRSALTPRPVNHMGVVQPSARDSRGRWVIIAAAVVIAAIGGVALAAVLGGDSESTKSETATETPIATPPPSADAASTEPKIASLADAAPVKADVPDAAPASDPVAATTLASTAPVVRGSLSTGAKLPQTTWGTDEGVLEDTPKIKPLEVPEKTDDGGDDKTDKSDKSNKRDKSDKSVKTDKRDERDKTDERDEREDDSQRLATLTRRASTAYRDRNFDRAARAASDAARLARGREASKLRKAAKSYEKLGDYLTKARKSADSNPRVALSAYIRASSVDRRVGGKHARFIRNQLLIVAPKAARKAMAADDLVGAKRAVDAARSAGDTVQTAGVTRSLENKARALISKGKRAQRDGDNDAARGAFNEARRILPRGSDLIDQIKELLSDLD